ncbi:MAG: hypothetical protein GF320_21875 [Armatimonadia bacterium]|nr:hypothetical protein [Armatimonadia bacterium]
MAEPQSGACHHTHQEAILRGRLDEAKARIAELEKENAKMKEALQRIALGIEDGDPGCRDCEGSGWIGVEGPMCEPCSCATPEQPDAIAAQALEGEGSDD